MIRVTTNGVLKGYKSSLMQSTVNLSNARDKVLTKRNFNSYAEDPASATQAFQIRRSLWRADTQLTSCKNAYSKFDSAFQTLGTIKNDLASTCTEAALGSISDGTGSGRKALGSTLQEMARSIVQSMNNKFGESYTFAGAEGDQLPFEWSENDGLLFRGVKVDVAPGSSDYLKLQTMLKETISVDVGLGLQEDKNGNLLGNSVFNASLTGIEFLGYGTDAEGKPNNLASIAMELGQILSGCDEDSGEWANPADKEKAEGLTEKLREAIGGFTSQYAEMDVKAKFLKTTKGQLENTVYTLNEQRLDIEQCDLADAISSFSWAQYCYNAALKVGNSILSQSLIDYMS